MFERVSQQRFFFPTLLMISFLILVGCSKNIPEQANTLADEALEVNTVVVEPQNWQASFDSYGYLESTETVTISIDFSGTVREVKFRAGEVVTAGQVLIELDSRKQKLQLQRAAANLERAKADLEKTQSTFQRHRNLATTGALSQEQFKQSQTDYERAAATLNEVEAALALAQQALRETTIISPVDGTVDERNVEPGQTVLPGNSLAVLEVTDTLRAVTYISQREVNLIRMGEVAPMTSPGVPGREYEARVELVGNSADPLTGNFVVKLTVNNSDRRLRAGMSVRLLLKGMLRENTLLIPKSALVDRNRRRVVYRLVDGRAQEVEPLIGVSNDDSTPVYGGLQAGDQLILSPLELIQDGKAVVVAASTPVAEQSPAANANNAETVAP